MVRTKRAKEVYELERTEFGSRCRVDGPIGSGGDADGGDRTRDGREGKGSQHLNASLFRARRGRPHAAVVAAAAAAVVTAEATTVVAAAVVTAAASASEEGKAKSTRQFGFSVVWRTIQRRCVPAVTVGTKRGLTISE